MVCQDDGTGHALEFMTCLVIKYGWCDGSSVIPKREIKGRERKTKLDFLNFEESNFDPLSNDQRIEIGFFEARSNRIPIFTINPNWIYSIVKKPKLDQETMVSWVWVPWTTGRNRDGVPPFPPSYIILPYVVTLE